MRAKVQLANLMVVCALSGPLLAQPKAVLINNVKEQASGVFDGKTVEEMMAAGGVSDWEFAPAEDRQRKAESALQALQKLSAAGVPASEIIEVDGVSYPITDLTEKLFTVQRESSKIGCINEVNRAATQANIWMEQLSAGKKLRPEELQIALMRGKELQQAVSKASRLGFPETFPFKMNEQTYTLPQLKEVADYVHQAGGQMQKSQLAELAAKDAPFLKRLSGDRLRIFKQEFANLKGSWDCRGPGGSSLNTPEALASAPVWYTWGNRQGVVDTWHITGFVFQGDHLSGRTSRSGYGLKPSPGDFR